MSKSRVSRFAIGSKSFPLSGVWRFWVQGNEVYIAERSGIKHVKISLHSTGKHKIEIGNDRFDLTGRRNFAKNLYHGPCLVFPYVDINKNELKPRSTFNCAFQWLEEPAPGCERIVVPIFSRNKPKQIKNEINFGLQKLRDGTYIWLKSLVGPISEKNKIHYKNMKDKLVIHYKGSLPTRTHSYMTWCERDIELNKTAIFMVPIDSRNWQPEDDSKQ